METITLFGEPGLVERLADISSHLNRICSYIRFTPSISSIHFETEIHFPESYGELNPTVIQETLGDLYTVFFTDRPYANNFFFEADGRLAIVSLHGWTDLTSLPITNGLVYFIADFLALELDNSYRHEGVTGCIFDFLWNKTGIDGGMRFAGICARCQARMSAKKLATREQSIFNDLKSILDDLGASSKWGNDILTYWRLKLTAGPAPVALTPAVHTTTLHELYARLPKASQAEKGKLFEDFCESFFGRITGWRVIGRDARLEDCEIDLAYDISDGPAVLTGRIGHNIYIECKNRATRSTVADISHFAGTLELRNLRAGIFFSRQGITGYEPDHWKTIGSAYRRIIDIYKTKQICILPLVASDIEQVINGKDLVEHLRELLNRFALL